MDRRQLEYFVAVADHRSFTSASHGLFIAQPSLSQAIKNLEGELGVLLFHRLRTGVRLTSVGEALLGPARQALRSFEVAEAAIVSVSNLHAGRLDIAALPALAADPLAAFLGAFHTAHPQVFVRIADPGLADVLDLVRSGDCEIGVTMIRREAPDLQFIELETEEVLLALPPDTPEFDGSTFPVAQVAELGLIVATATKALLTRILSAEGVRPRFVLETGHREAIVPFVLQGVGAALVPPRTARLAAALGARICPLEPPITRQVAFFYRQAELSPAARTFLDIVRTTAGDAALTGRTLPEVRHWDRLLLAQEVHPA